MSNIDSLLLEREVAGNLREQRNKNEEPEESPQSLRQAQFNAAKKKAILDEMKKKVAMPVKMGTNRILRWAWLTLIPSWGLTLIYINIHVFLRFVLGEKLFCKFGDEWIPKNAQEIGGAIGIIEVMILIFLDVLAVLIIGAILALIVMIVSWLSASWAEKAGMMWDAFSSLGFGAVSVIGSLF